MEIISSRENRIYKDAVSLKDKKFRDKTGLFLVEGPNFVRDALSSGGRAKFIFTSAEQHSKETEDIISFSKENGSAIIELTEELFKNLSDTNTPQQVIGVFEKPVFSEADLFKGNVLVLDRIQDPGNLGTMLRTAEAMNFSGVLLLKGSADVFQPKVVRAEASSIFRMPSKYIESEEELFQLLKNQNKKLFAATMNGKTKIFDAKLSSDIALVIGNEGNGVSQSILKEAEEICIPMAGNIESLNAAMAAGIIMYESFRQKGN